MSNVFDEIYAGLTEAINHTTSNMTSRSNFHIIFQMHYIVY